MNLIKEHWYRGEPDSSTTKLYSDNNLKSVFSTKTIIVGFGCSKANWPSVGRPEGFEYFVITKKNLFISIHCVWLDFFFTFQLREVETAPHLENYFSEEEKALYDFLFSSEYRQQMLGRREAKVYVKGKLKRHYTWLKTCIQNSI